MYDRSWDRNDYEELSLRHYLQHYLTIILKESQELQIVPAGSSASLLNIIKYHQYYWCLKSIYGKSSLDQW